MLVGGLPVGAAVCAASSVCFPSPSGGAGAATRGAGFFTVVNLISTSGDVSASQLKTHEVAMKERKTNMAAIKTELDAAVADLNEARAGRRRRPRGGAASGRRATASSGYTEWHSSCPGPHRAKHTRRPASAARKKRRQAKRRRRRRRRAPKSILSPMCAVAMRRRRRAVPTADASRRRQSGTHGRTRAARFFHRPKLQATNGGQKV